MKAAEFSEPQIAFVLKQAEDRTPIGEVCRRAGISDATFYDWRKKYAPAAVGNEAVAASRRRGLLEEENAKLKRIVVDLLLDKAESVTILPLSPKSPELSPVENLWLFMRENWL